MEIRVTEILLTLQHKQTNELLHQFHQKEWFYKKKKRTNIEECYF